MSKGSKIGIGLGIVVLAVILFTSNSSLNKGSFRLASSPRSAFAPSPAPAPAPVINQIQRPALETRVPDITVAFTGTIYSSNNGTNRLGAFYAGRESFLYPEYRLMNIGTADITPQNLRVRKDIKFKYTSKSVGSGSSDGTYSIAIRAGATDGPRREGFRLPASITAGTYTLEICADSDSQISELNENNNCATQDIIVTNL